MAGDYDYVFKVLVLGDSSVGKSSLIKRFHSNVFDQRLPTTIGVDFFIHDMEVDGKKVKVSLPGVFFLLYVLSMFQPPEGPGFCFITHP